MQLSYLLYCFSSFRYTCQGEAISAQEILIPPQTLTSPGVGRAGGSAENTRLTLGEKLVEMITLKFELKKLCNSVSVEFRKTLGL